MKRKTFKMDNLSARGDFNHLHFIISDPDADGSHMVVNSSSCYDTPSTDHSCDLFPGDHPEISRASIIMYNFASEMTRNQIVQKGMRKHIIMKADVNPVILQRIQDGARNSNHLRNHFRKYFLLF
jgi:hypothetical protein